MVLRNKSSTTPVTSANWQGLQSMSVNEIKNYIASVLTVSFGANSDGTGTGEINITTNDTGSGTSIGTFVDTYRQEATGTHPATGDIDTVTYYAKQVTAAATENITNRPIKYDNGLREMTDAQIDSELLDYAINAMISESTYTAGQYRLQPSAPVGGTWVARYTLTDVANGGNTETYLWQKTAATTSPDSNLKPLKLIDTKDVREMSSSEIQQMLPNFRNRIIDTGIGTYRIQSTAPDIGGTWVEFGDEFADTREEVSPQNYVGNFTGTYTGIYAGSRNYTGSYAGSRNYAGNYASNFTGTYTGNFSGTFTRFFGGFVGGNFVGTFAGNFTGTYTGIYAGSRNYTGSYAGSRNYAGNYASNYTGTYTGTFSGATVLETKETVSTVKLWIRTA
jgi:ribosomal protein L29